ncbi:hypothetical protein [Stenotrophomonas phage RAS14]
MTSHSPLIIGINGIAGAGKDTIANMVALSLDRDNGFKVKTFAFADRLKQASAVVFGVPLEHFYDRIKKEEVVPFWNMSPRQMAQKMGTEACRQGIRDDIWFKALHQEIMASGVDVAFITDVRFDNEALYVRGETFEPVEGTNTMAPHNPYPGVVVNIFRTNQSLIADSDHVSEKGIKTELKDETIENVNGNPFAAAAALQRIVISELEHRRGKA